MIIPSRSVLITVYPFQRNRAITMLMTVPIRVPERLASAWLPSVDYLSARRASVPRRYYAANTVSLPREVEQIWGCGGPLNGACALHHYCTVTRLNPESYRECYSSYAYPLASDASSAAPLRLALHLLVLLVCAELLRNR